jgi:putative GTP pyrophosphokinase
MMNREDYHRNWYETQSHIYDELRKLVEESIRNRLDQEGFKKNHEYVLVDSRLKTADSFLTKMEKFEEGKFKYSNPTEITDIAGIRIVACIMSDIQKLSSLIERDFHIDTNRSEDKSKKLEHNKLGYRSINYVATLSYETLEDAPEYKKFDGLNFEIQVKSILDFAWDVIEHDRNYKALQEYPGDSDIARRFYLMAGLLEVADNELEYLSQQAAMYDNTLLKKIEEGQYIEITPLSLRLYLTKIFGEMRWFKPYFRVIDDILDELRSMGITSITQLHQIIPDRFDAAYREATGDKDYVTLSALVRDILILYNPQEYFSVAWKHHYNCLDHHSAKLFNKLGKLGDVIKYLPPELEIGEPD